MKYKFVLFNMVLKADADLSSTYSGQNRTLQMKRILREHGLAGTTSMK